MKTKLRIIISIQLIAALISSLSARNSASHTLTIRIVRSTQVSIQPVPSENTEFSDAAQSSEQNFQMNWLANNNQTKISVAAEKKDSNTPLILNNNGRTIEINDINMDLMQSTPDIKGNYQFNYQNRDETQATVFYTMTDA